MSTVDVVALLKQYLPLLIPIILIELALLIIALVDVVRRPNTNGPKLMWVLIIILVNVIGPILYFIIGRKEE